MIPWDVERSEELLFHFHHMFLYVLIIFVVFCTSKSKVKSQRSTNYAFRTGGVRENYVQIHHDLEASEKKSGFSGPSGIIYIQKMLPHSAFQFYQADSFLVSWAVSTFPEVLTV